MKKLIVLLLLVAQHTWGQALFWKNITTNPETSFRGLSVVDDSVAWISGTKGRVGISTDGGNNWKLMQVVGFETLDFRTLYAFNAKSAVIANAGSPAYIFTTDDGGINWKLVYKTYDTAAFIDGIDFWNNKEGIIYGDPINKRLMLLRTKDGGNTWAEIPTWQRPLLMDGEASFAASGTNIKCSGKGKIMIATGGKVSRLWVSIDKGAHWGSMPTPIYQGLTSTGIFSFAFRDDKNGVIVGGDYKQDSVRYRNVFYTTDGGKIWKAPKATTRGYRECVTYIDRKTVIATGPGGTDISHDGGASWDPSSDEKQYHAFKKSRKGNLLIMTGGAGKIRVTRP